MADNTTLNAGTGGDVIASDDIAGVKYQRVKLSVGADGAAADAASGGGVEAGSLRVTIANDSTGVLSVDDNGGSLTVDVGTALPAGTNAIGKLAANSGVDIGDVDVTSIIPGTGATNLGKAEDAAHTTGDVGVMVLAVRNDAGSALAGATGDYIPLSTDSSGALRVVGSSGTTQYAEDSVAASGDSGVVMLAVRRDTAASSSGTDGDYSTLNTDATGNLRVNVTSGGVAGVANDAALTVGTSEGVSIMGRASAAAPTDVSADNDAVHIWTLRSGAQVVQQSYAGILASTGNGASGTGVPRVTIANDSTGVLAAVTNVATIGTSVTPGTSAAHLGKAEDAAHASGDTGVMVLAVRQDTQATLASATGDYVPFTSDSVGSLYVRNTNELADDSAFTVATSRVSPTGFLADETATDSVDEGDIGIGRMTLDRKQIVTLQPHTQGGLSIFRSLDIDETEEDVKTSAGQVYWIHAMNMVATARYLKFYNATAANVTVGTTTPVLTLPLPANSTTGAGFTVSIPQGLAFSTAICVACTTGVADNDTGAPGANDVIINIGYM